MGLFPINCFLKCPEYTAVVVNLLVLMFLRSDRLPTGHPDGPRGIHQEPGPRAESAEGEDWQAGAGEGGPA